MNNFTKLLTVDREFIFNGQLTDFNERLGKLKDIRCNALSDREIKFSPFISLGTMVISGAVGLVDGINVRAIISDTDTNQLKINLKTKVRPEHYFIIVLFIFSFVAIIFSNESKWLIPYVFGLWIICHAWFQFIYQLQENHLIEKIVSKLRLREI
ncbi:MAG: hypothetical protein JSU09_01365 [Bacteroidetes bacterium]|nr:hypothetical protein [Bacteroidota bacterium]